MMDMELARQHREEVLRGVAPNRRARALLAPVGEVRAGLRSTPAWEAQRHVGRLPKLFRASRKTG